MKHKCGRKALPAHRKADNPQSIRLTPEAKCALTYLRTSSLQKFNLSGAVCTLILQLAGSQGFYESEAFAAFKEGQGEEAESRGEEAAE